MDALHREVTALVEKAAHEKEDPRITFRRIRRRFRNTTGAGFDEDLPEEPPEVDFLPARRLPRLTESWFC
jgi:hypothetical protein